MLPPRAVALQVALVVALGSRTIASLAAPVLVAVIPAEDARRSVVIGTNGEVYEGDGAGAWVRTRLVTTAGRITAAGRGGDAADSIVAVGDGVIYRLAANGWSAMRIANKLHAVMSSGPRAVAAAGTVIVALGGDHRPEAPPLATAGSTVLALGSGKRVVFATDRGVFRIDRKRVVAVKSAPRRVNAFAGDRWGLVDHGAVDLRSGRVTAWPADLEIRAAAQAPDEHLFAAGTATGGGVVVLELGGIKIARATVDGVSAGIPAAVVADAKDRIVVVFRDGRIALREHATWTVSTVRDEPPPPHPGSPPATSP